MVHKCPMQRRKHPHSRMKEMSCGVLPMQLLFCLYHQETKSFLQQATESKLSLLLCAVEAPALSPSYRVMLTQPLNCWVQEKKGRRKRSLTSIWRRLLLPTVLCTAPGLPAKASQSAKVVSTTRATLPGGCCWGFARQRTAQEDRRKGQGRVKKKKKRISSRVHLNADRAEIHSWQGMHLKLLFNLRADISITISNICLASWIGGGNNLPGCYMQTD